MESEKKDQESIKNVLDFYINDCITYDNPGEPLKGVDSALKNWFGIGLDEASKEQLDQEIKGRFGTLILEREKQVREKGYQFGEKNNLWDSTADGMLATLLLFDQFPRSVYRGQKRSFSFDDLALELANYMVGNGIDKQLSPIRRVFVYLPFEHSEILDNQNKCVELYTKLSSDADIHPNDTNLFKEWIKYAEKHRDLIKKFGRFPYRNSILGRQSTEEELKSTTTFI